MTEKQYKVITDNLDEYSVLRYDGSIVSTEITNKAVAELFCDELNEQDRQINELEDKLENWKQLATVAQSENSILHNELGIAIEQGYTLSDAFKEYKKGVVTDDN